MKNTFFKKPTIIIVDDHLIFRQSLNSLISTENIGKVIGEASDGKEFLDLLEFAVPDLVLMDIDMPKMNGMEATQRALELYPNLKIVTFTMFGDTEYYDKMLELGVKGFLLKSSGITEVEDAIKAIMKGETYFSKSLPKSTVNKLNLDIPKTNKPKSDTATTWWG